MATIWEKIGMLVSVDIHAKLDEALRKRDVGVLKLYIRDAEQAVEELNNSIAVIEANNQGFGDKVTEWMNEGARHQKGFDSLLVEQSRLTKQKLEIEATGNAATLQMLTARLEENKTLVYAAQSKLAHDRDMKQSYLDKVVEGNANVAKQRSQRLILEKNIDFLKGKLDEVEATVEQAKATETVVKAREKANDVLGRGDSDIDGIVDDARKRQRIAQNKLDEMDNTLDHQLSEHFASAEAEDEIARRKKELGLE